MRAGPRHSRDRSPASPVHDGAHAGPQRHAVDPLLLGGGALDRAAQLARTASGDHRDDRDDLVAAGDHERVLRRDRAHHDPLALRAAAVGGDDDRVHGVRAQAEPLRATLLVGPRRLAGEQPVEQVAPAALDLGRERVALGQEALGDRDVDHVRVAERPRGHLLRDPQAFGGVAGGADDRLPGDALTDQVRLLQRVQRHQLARALRAARSHEVELGARGHAVLAPAARDQVHVLDGVGHHLGGDRRIADRAVLVDLLADGHDHPAPDRLGVPVDLVEDLVVQGTQRIAHFAVVWPEVLRLCRAQRTNGMAKRLQSLRPSRVWSQ